MNLKEYKMQERIFALFVGQSGSGKSDAAASFPWPFHEMDFDLRANGIVAAINQGWLCTNRSLDDIDIKQFDPLGGWVQVQNHLNDLRGLFRNGVLKTQTIDIGSLTSMTRLFKTTAVLTPLNDKAGGGHFNLAGLSMTGPSDYNFEAQATHAVFDFLKGFPCHVICSAHIIDKWGKPPGAKEISANEVIGEKLSITDKLGANVLTYFNDVYRFSKAIVGGQEKFFVEFSTEMAKNSFGLPPGKFDITRKEFYPFLQDLIQKVKAGEAIKPNGTPTGNLLTF